MGFIAKQNIGWDGGERGGAFCGLGLIGWWGKGVGPAVAWTRYPWLRPALSRNAYFPCTKDLQGCKSDVLVRASFRPHALSVGRKEEKDWKRKEEVDTGTLPSVSILPGLNAPATLPRG